MGMDIIVMGYKVGIAEIAHSTIVTSHVATFRRERKGRFEKQNTLFFIFKE